MLGREAFKEEHSFYTYGLHISLDPLGFFYTWEIEALCVMLETMSMATV